MFGFGGSFPALPLPQVQKVLLQIKLLVEEGKADVLKTDRWGATALDEVTKLGATRCMAYLKPITEAAMQRQRQQQEEEEAALDAAAKAQLH